MASESDVGVRPKTVSARTLKRKAAIGNVDKTVKPPDDHTII